MKTMTLLGVLVLVGCTDSVTAPSACAGRLVHYRVAMALQATEDATCEPVGHDSAWTCSC